MSKEQKKISTSNNPAGRPKGSLNKRTLDAVAIALELECDPFEVLIHFAKGDVEALGYKKSIDGKEVQIGPELRLQAAKEAASYIYPKRKAVEHSFDPKNLGDSELLEKTRKLLEAAENAK